VTLSQIRETDNALSQIVGDAHLRIPNALEGTPVQTTAKVLSSLVAGLVSLKSGVLDLAATGNVYGTFVLFRVFLEHIVKTKAIFLKALDEQSDDFAKQYLRLRIKEAYDYLHACEQAGLQIGGNRKTVLDEWIPDAQALSCKEVKRLDEQFKYRGLIRTIRELINSDFPDFLSKIIPNYSELSGFVHGGPTAREKLAVLHSEGRAEAKLYHVADLSVDMLYSAQRWLLMLAAAFCPEFDQLYNSLDKALNAQTEHSAAPPSDAE